MKKQLMFLLVCFGLIAPGSGLVNGLHAQTAGKRTARQPANPTKTQKQPSELKAPSLRAIAQNRKAPNAAAGDPCNSDTPIAFDAPVNGSLGGGDCQLQDGTFIDFYSFSGRAGQPVAISMSSSQFDTYLYLLDDAGNVIDSNDDSGPTTDSRIPMDGGVITLPYTGVFYIGANSYDPSSGTYSITLATDASCSATSIGYNQTVNGSLAGTDCAVNIGGEPFYTDLYTFNGTAGQQISIAMNSAAVNAYLILHTPSGEGSLEDDDSGGGTNARIPTSGTFTLPETGTYTIEASSYNSFETGDYTLVVTGPEVTPSGNKYFDYDGDGKADLSVFRAATATWYIQNSGTANTYDIQNFGDGLDTIAPADYDGDGKTDIAVFRSSNNTWYTLNSADGTTSIVTFGAAGDTPVAADYDGDGKADIAVWRSGTGEWWISQSGSGTVAVVRFGMAGDLPQRGDFDGDGKTDLVVYRPTDNVWYRLNSSDAQVVAYQFGLATDLRAPADYDGDGKADIAVYRPTEGNWYIANSGSGNISIVNFGLSVDLPVPADYDGDGKADLAVFRTDSAVWYLQRSTDGFVAQGFGLPGDKPTPVSFVR
ncbi:MAG: VCBS repeat-containing protein [Acidobacteria bacterium]|nr:VCBS repeat-containing protein [Acidobacteriota bacterium]